MLRVRRRKGVGASRRGLSWGSSPTLPPERQPQRYIRLVLFPLFLISCIALLVATGTSDRDGLGIGLICAVIVVPIVIGYGYFGAPYFRAKSTFRSSPNMRSPIRYAFSDDRITQETATARAELTWETYIKIRETSGYFLLFPQKLLA
jgi:hypothetical protein